MGSTSSFLKVQGTKIVDGNGNEAVLRGAGLGGWMNMENFISGYPAHEFQIREALAEVVGQEKSDFFFDKYLEYFFQPADAAFFKSLGLNCIRIAINYRHFEDDMNPRVLKTSGFKHLDRAIDICAQNGIYTVIDMHTAPGGQNGGWHCDSGIHLAKFWEHKGFQDSLVWLWEEIAKRYKNNTWVAGYNLLNEPSDEKGTRLIALYDRVISAVRNIDKNHIVFLDGNTYATDFTQFPDDAGTRWPNTAFAIHDYSAFGFPDAPEPYTGTDEQKQQILESYQGKREWMDQRGLCVWNGEWGPVYARAEYDGDQTDQINEMRFAVLRDQLSIYTKDRLSWSIWLYKDIGFQGMVHVSLTTSYMTLFKDFLAKKHRLAADSWGVDDTFVRGIYDPLVDLITQNVKGPEDLQLYPYPVWTVQKRVDRLARAILVAEYLVREWAESFRGMDATQLDDLAKSFLFENCVKRDGLNDVLRQNANELQK